MPPKVSIIICIYNVEAYLRECLDSVVNQTLQEIQIICVNDGSLDNSRALLQEYADRDPRIEIIDQENQGLGVARNNALARTRGQYVYLADPDDFIERDLCRTLYLYAESQSADVVFLLRDTTDSPIHTPTLSALVYSSPLSVEDRKELLNTQVGAVGKFCSNKFLRSNGIKFSHHRRSQDAIYHWKVCLYCTRPAFIPMVLYHQRIVTAPKGTGKWKHVQDVSGVYSQLKSFLEKEGFFEDYHEKFYLSQFQNIRAACSNMSPESFEIFKSQMRPMLDKHVIDFLKTNRRISSRTRNFFLALHENRTSKWRVYWSDINRLFILPAVKFVKSVIHGITGKNRKIINMQYRQQIVQLSELVGRLCNEIVELRKDGTGYQSGKKAA